MLRANYGFIVFVHFFVGSMTASLDDLKQNYINIITECMKDFNFKAEDLANLKDNNEMPSEEMKCFHACIFKKAGMMDENGMLSVQNMHEMSQKYLSDEPEKMKQSEEFAEICKSVNDVPVSDGAKGCERAALIHKCSIENGSKFNFGI